MKRALLSVLVVLTSTASTRAVMVYPSGDPKPPCAQAGAKCDEAAKGGYPAQGGEGPRGLRMPEIGIRVLGDKESPGDDCSDKGSDCKDDYSKGEKGKPEKKCDGVRSKACGADGNKECLEGRGGKKRCGKECEKEGDDERDCGEKECDAKRECGGKERDDGKDCDKKCAEDKERGKGQKCDREGGARDWKERAKAFVKASVKAGHKTHLKACREECDDQDDRTSRPGGCSCNGATKGALPAGSAGSELSTWSHLTKPVAWL